MQGTHGRSSDRKPGLPAGSRTVQVTTSGTPITGTARAANSRATGALSVARHQPRQKCRAFGSSTIVAAITTRRPISIPSPTRSRGWSTVAATSLAKRRRMNSRSGEWRRDEDCGSGGGVDTCPPDGARSLYRQVDSIAILISARRQGTSVMPVALCDGRGGGGVKRVSAAAVSGLDGRGVRHPRLQLPSAP